jgi:hypothetical protein
MRAFLTPKNAPGLRNTPTAAETRILIEHGIAIGGKPKPTSLRSASYAFAEFLRDRGMVEQRGRHATADRVTN